MGSAWGQYVGRLGTVDGHIRGSVSVDCGVYGQSEMVCGKSGASVWAVGIVCGQSGDSVDSVWAVHGDN